MESPTKARTIRRFLPRRFQVEASMGHLRDLPASAAEIPAEFKDQQWARLGVQVDQDFKPLYVISSGKRRVVTSLKSALRQADELLIATDEDREGESIGWHLVELLKPRVPVRRMVFHEITESAIVQALAETREIDQNLVDAQETRRILDRLVGYTISPLLWKKIAPRLSAGRVQSVAVRLLVLREKERLKFVPAQYRSLKATLAKGGSPFEATMTHLGGIRLATGRDFDPDTGRLKEGLVAGREVMLLTEARARGVADGALTGSWRVKELEERESSRSPAPPFTTSTLQQEASRKLRLSARETMRIAQHLYENGHITYMRTDSTHLAQEALVASRRAVEQRYGRAFLSPRPRQFRGRARNAQEAHEAIRPAGAEMRTRTELGLSQVEGALYDLIWKRTVATQMADARLKFVTARIEASGADEPALFRATGRTTLFPGFFRAYLEGTDDPDAVLEDRDQPLPELAEGDRLDCNELTVVGHETKPPARYTEASLVKLLEQEGIGRPSTYASIIDTVIRRGYVRKSGNQLVPSFTAFATNNLLERQFARLVDTEFTATMEAALDDIASGTLEPTPYLRDFFLGEDGLEAKVGDGLEAIDARSISTLESPKWDPYRVRVGRFGPFVEGEVGGELRSASLPDDLAPAELSRERIEELLSEGKAGDTVVGSDPETGKELVLRTGSYGPYLQLGGGEEGGRPKRVSLPPELAPHDISERIALELLALPKALGTHPESGKPILVGIGRYGPYVRHEQTYASLPKGQSLFEVDLGQAAELIAAKEDRNRPLRSLGDHPESGKPVSVLKGRYGPYIKHERTNATLPRNLTPEGITLKQALELLAAKEAKKPGRKRRGKAAERSPGRAQKAKAKPKATTAELARHLEVLEPEVAEVVARVEGLNGNSATDAETVAKLLGRSEREVAAMYKRGMFKLRMAYGKARREAGP